MTELRLNIFPVCSYGRAENIYYQSEGSLCPLDLNFEEIIGLVANIENPLFPSHIIDREDWLHLRDDLSRCCKPRILISLGREWEEISEKVIEATAYGWGLDILIDRPLNKLLVPENLKSIADVRWIACPLRFFDLKELVISLLEYKPQRAVFLCFLEPRDRNSLLLNPDEVVLLKQKISTIYANDVLNTKFLILNPKFKRTENFYSDPSLKSYRENFIELGDYKKMRGAVSGSLKNYPRFFSMMIYIFALFFSRAQRAQQVEIIYWKLFSAYSNTRWFLGQVGWRFYSIGWRIYSSVFWSIRWFLSLVRLSCIHLFWFSRHNFLSFCRGVMCVYRIVFWPIHKIYWMVEYQYLKRIHPYVRDRFSND